MKRTEVYSEVTFEEDYREAALGLAWRLVPLSIRGEAISVVQVCPPPSRLAAPLEHEVRFHPGALVIRCAPRWFYRG